MAISAVKSVPTPTGKAEPASGDTPAAAPHASKKKRLLIAAIILLLAGGGTAAWAFLRPGAAGKEAHKSLAAKPPVYAPLEIFTVNLNQEVGEQYLQVAVTLLVPDQAQAELIKLYMPMVRSRMLTLLSSKKAGELATVDGKQKLADDIKARLQQPFVPNSAPPLISSVLFTSFVIQ